MAHPLIETSLTEIKLGEFSVAAASALKDPTWLPQVQNYKRQIASRMYPLGKADIDRKIPDSEYLVSRKIDGEFSGLIYEDGHLITVNPGGRVRMGMPWQTEAVNLIKAAGIEQAMFAGELYVAPEEDRRARVHDVVSVVRQPESQADLERIRFAVFDIIQLETEPALGLYSENWQKLVSIFSKGDRCHLVETVSIKGHRDVQEKFSSWVEGENAEGLIVRSDAAGNFKVKPRHTLDAVVIGFTESTDDRQGMMHDLLMGMTRQDGSIQVLGRVGGGFSEDLRRTLLSDLNDIVVESEYAEVNSDHVAYKMVEPKVVIEISCLDLIAQNTRGGPVNRMVLSWSREENQYKVIRRMPFVSIISPQFIRIREDKSLNASDVRLSQVTDLVPVAKSDIDAGELKLPKSQLLQREVYTKQLRGEMLVRKFLLWKTNKQTDSQEYPAFVIYYTDFSPSRKTPLAREVRVTNSETQAIALFRAFKEDYIKKGWELHSQSGEMTSDIEKNIEAAAHQAKIEATETKSIANKKKPPQKKLDDSGTKEKKPVKKKAVKKTKAAAKKASPKKKTAKKKTAKKKSKQKKADDQ